MKVELLAQLYRRKRASELTIFKLEDEMNAILRNATPEEYEAFQREMMIVDTAHEDKLEYLEEAKWKRIRKYKRSDR